MIALLLGGIGLGLLGLSVRLFYSGLHKSGEERILQRLGQRQEALTTAAPSGRRGAFERMLLRAGLDWRSDRPLLWLVSWAGVGGLGGLLAGVLGAVLALLFSPLLLVLYMNLLYRRRVRRLIEQLPGLLDYAVRSLKSGRTLSDAVLGGVDAASEPLNSAMQRVRRNVQMGVSLDDAVADMAELYEQDELRLLALGLRINHRYGGNASELLENLIKTIREREQGARQLRAMTGETRMTAMVLAALPVALLAYFMIGNSEYLMRMWNDGSGRIMLLSALGLQATGCLVLWRMMRSI